MTAWLVVAVVGAVTGAFKASGPVPLGRRELAPRALALVSLLAPALLAALVVTLTFGGDRELTVDARGLGVGVAALAYLRGAPVLAGMALAALVTALARLA